MSDKEREKSKEGIVNLFNEYLLSALYGPGIFLDIWSLSVKNIQRSCPHGAYVGAGKERVHNVQSKYVYNVLEVDMYQAG